MISCSSEVLLACRSAGRRSCLPRAFSTSHVDVLVVGGAAMGSSIAYHLKKKQPSLSVAVVDRDLKYTTCATSLSVGSIRQQFSIKENIELSFWSYHFLSKIGKHLKVAKQDAPDVQLTNRGYLYLYSKKGLKILEENVALQKSLGCNTAFLDASQLKEQFPWLNVDGVAAGSLGMEYEGHFDPWSLVTAFQRKAASLGVTYIEGDVTKISCSGKALVTGATVETDNGQHKITCGSLVNAGGPWANAVTKCLEVNLPVRPRKRFVFVFKAPHGPPSDTMPMLIDRSGIYCRPEGHGNVYICGRSPVSDDPDASDLEVDYDFFEEHIWPTLATRVPCLNELKVQHSWAGYYEYNTVDQNGIIGVHPRITNLYFANGFSGHGIQQSPAVGNAIAELIVDGKYTTIDLTRFSIERILRRKPLREKNII